MATTMKDHLDKARDSIADLHKKIDADVTANEASLRTNLDKTAASARQIATDLSKGDFPKPDVKERVAATIAHLQDAAKDTKANATASFDELKKRNAAMLVKIRDAAHSASQAIAARRHDAKGN